MGPGSSPNINNANSISGQQLNVASQAGQQSANNYQQFLQLMQPLIQQQTGLASGNRQDALAAAMPMISQLSSGFQGAKQQIMNSMPAGAARDRALADLTTQRDTTIAGAQANAVQNAPNVLAGVGSNYGQMSLQELGAQLSGLSGGATTNYNAGQLAAQQQASMLNFFSGLAGTVGGMFDPIKLCWVAEAVYGQHDPRTILVRQWLTNVWRKQSIVGACVMLLYRIIGKPTAWVVKRSATLQRLFKPLFDAALRRAIL